MIKALTRPATLSLAQGLTTIEGYPEQLVNWTFDDPLQDTDPNNNVLEDQWYNHNATLAVANGNLTVTNTAGYGSARQRLDTLEAGKDYKFIAECIGGVSRVFLGTSDGSNQIHNFPTEYTASPESPAVVEHTFTWGSAAYFYVRLMTHSSRNDSVSTWTFATLKEV